MGSQERFTHQTVATEEQLYDQNTTIPYSGIGRGRKEDDGARQARAVWLKVIVQAEGEAEGRLLWGIPPGERPEFIRAARKWLCEESEDLVQVCYLAGGDRRGLDVLLKRNRAKYGLDGTKGKIDFEGEDDEHIRRGSVGEGSGLEWSGGTAAGSGEGAA